MGKKSKEASHDPSDAVKSLFSADNPFRRKSQSDPKADRPAPPLSQRPETIPAPPPEKAEHDCVDAAEERKRKRKREREKAGNPNPSPDHDSIPKKRKKLEVADEGASPMRKRKKRKRDELEEGYERRKYGAAVEDSERHGEGRAAAVVGAKRKVADASSELVVSKESFDDESKLLRTVFVGNLPLKTKRKALLKEFARFGEVESVRIRSVPIIDTKTPRKGAIFKGEINEAIDSVHAYIVFKDEQSAHTALSHNMAEVGGNHIRVDMACPPRKKLKGETPLYERKKTVFVGNLPFDVKDEELYRLFFGSNPSESSVEAVRVIRDPQTSFGKGIAYVLFKTREAANSTVKKRDLKIRDRLLRLSHAKSDATPLKRARPESKRDFPHKRMASSYSGEPSSTRSDKPKAAPLAYQGLRSSKSGVLKKTGLRPASTGGHRSIGSNRATGANQKKNPRSYKRPSVAARKAKGLVKRKQESGTPENSRQNKRFKKN